MEYQMLWQLTRKQRITGDLHAMIQNQVKQVRKNFRTTKRDPLVEKFLNFGNEGLWSTEKLRELANVLYEHKTPEAVNLGEWISVEIEGIMPSEDAETKFIKFIRKNNLQKYITIKNDGSLRVISPNRLNRDEERRLRDEIGTVNMARLRVPPRMPPTLQQEQQETRLAFGREIVMTFRYGDWKFVRMVCEELRRLKFYVNSSCGMHVHFDCRHLKADDVGRIAKRLVYAVPALKQILPQSRQENRFCARDINEFQGRNEDRYAFINLQAFTRHQTLEIRAHGGTTDPVKIINWIRILRKIMNKRKPVQTASELINAFKMDKDLIEYINERYNRFHRPLELPAEQAHMDDIEVDDTVVYAVSEEIEKSQPMAVGQSRPLSDDPVSTVEYRAELPPDIMQAVQALDEAARMLAAQGDARLARAAAEIIRGNDPERATDEDDEYF